MHIAIYPHLPLYFNVGVAYANSTCQFRLKTSVSSKRTFNCGCNRNRNRTIAIVRLRGASVCLLPVCAATGRDWIAFGPRLNRAIGPHGWLAIGREVS